MLLAAPGYDGPLWNDMGILAGIERPRIATTPMDRMEADRHGKHNAYAILATPASLNEDSRRNDILERLRAICGFAKDSDWRKQRAFLNRMMGSFFGSGDGCSAWITIYPKRLTSRFRQAKGCTLDQTIESHVRRGEGRSLHRHTFCLGSSRFCGRGMLMNARPGTRAEAASIAHQTVRRTLPDGPGRRVHIACEEWCFLHSAGQDDDQAKVGRIPAMLEAGLMDEGTGILNAPIFSLGKLPSPHSYAEFLSVNLHPDSGAVLDFRSMDYDPAYYFISARDNHSLLRATVTPGHWERF